MMIYEDVVKNGLIFREKKSIRCGIFTNFTESLMLVPRGLSSSVRPATGGKNKRQQEKSLRSLTVWFLKT